MKNDAVMADISYYELLKLTGVPTAISSLLHCYLPPVKLPPPSYLTGGRALENILFTDKYGTGDILGHAITGFACRVTTTSPMESPKLDMISTYFLCFPGSAQVIAKFMQHKISAVGV